MTDQRAPAGDEATVTAGDIARLAEVGKAAVSNWRRRYTDFPQPVGGSSASPLYALDEVTRWLSEHGRGVRLSPTDEIWPRVRAVVDDLRLGELLGVLGALLVLRERDPRRWAGLRAGPDTELPGALAAALPEVVPDVPGQVAVDPAWGPVLRLVADSGAGAAALVDELAERYREVHSRRLSLTPEPVAALMAELAGVSGGTVLDPACGTGGLLVAAVSAGATAAWGQEIVPDEARLAAARLLLRTGAVPPGADRRVRVAIGDSLRADAFPGHAAGAVVCEPPFSDRAWGYDELASDPRWAYGLPPRGEPELAWLQHCLAHVEPGGWAAVLMPPAAAARRSGRRIRGNLLRAGALRAVLGLPPGGQSAAAPDLWMLRRPGADPDDASHLLVVDASGDMAVAREAWRAFRARADLPAGATTVRIIDLLDDEVDLSPGRHLRSGRPADAAGYAATRERLGEALGALLSALPDLRPGPAAAPVTATTVGDLIKAGVLVSLSAPLRMGTDAGPHPVLTAADVRAGRAPTGRGSAGPGTVRLRPGDVALPAVPREPAAYVVGVDGVLLGPQLVVLRADADRLDPNYLAGLLRAAQAAHGASLLSGRTDVRRIPVPLLPVAEQRRRGAAYARLAAVTARLHDITALGAAAVRQALVGLADGTLRPD